MDSFSVLQGTALPLTVTIADDQGNPITTYSGSEGLAAEVWPGGDRAASFAATATWNTPSAGTVDVMVTGTQTAMLEEGRYLGAVILQDPVDGPLEAYVWAIDVGLAPGSAPAPTVYCRFSDMLTYGRSWLVKLQGDDDQEGFARQRGRARSWLDDVILAHYTGASSSYGQIGMWNYGSTPSAWLRGILDGGGLISRDWVVEATAKRALGFVCESQIGPAKDNQYTGLANRFKNEAASIVMGHVAEITTNSPPGTTPNLWVHLGSSNLRPTW